MDLDTVFPDLFSKTFFILGLQLVITSLAIYAVFVGLRTADPVVMATGSDDNMERNIHPEYRWICSKPFIHSLIAVWFATFLLLRFWGIYQSLFTSLTLFSFWSIEGGVMLELVLVTFDHALGQRAIAITAITVLATAVVGIFAHIDVGFLQWPLFVGLTGLVGLSLMQLLGAMRTIRQRWVSSFAVVLFTLYLLYDFNTLAKREAESASSWADAAKMAIKIYLDIINLLMHLVSRHHH